MMDKLRITKRNIGSTKTKEDYIKRISETIQYINSYPNSVINIQTLYRLLHASTPHLTNTKIKEKSLLKNSLRFIFPSLEEKLRDRDLISSLPIIVNNLMTNDHEIQGDIGERYSLKTIDRFPLYISYNLKDKTNQDSFYYLPLNLPSLLDNFFYGLGLAKEGDFRQISFQQFDSKGLEINKFFFIDCENPTIIYKKGVK